MSGAESTVFLVQFDCAKALHRHCSLGKVTAVPAFKSSGTVTAIGVPFNMSTSAATCNIC